MEQPHFRVAMQWPVWITTLYCEILEYVWIDWTLPCPSVENVASLLARLSWMDCNHGRDRLPLIHWGLSPPRHMACKQHKLLAIFRDKNPQHWWCSSKLQSHVSGTYSFLLLLQWAAWVWGSQRWREGLSAPYAVFFPLLQGDWDTRRDLRSCGFLTWALPVFPGFTLPFIVPEPKKPLQALHRRMPSFQGICLDTQGTDKPLCP